MPESEFTEKECAGHVIAHRPLNNERLLFAIQRHVNPACASFRLVQLRTPAATTACYFCNLLISPALLHFDSPPLSYS
jgi:hypothetical protein